MLISYPILWIIRENNVRKIPLSILPLDISLLKNNLEDSNCMSQLDLWQLSDSFSQTLRWRACKEQEIRDVSN